MSTAAPSNSVNNACNLGQKLQVHLVTLPIIYICVSRKNSSDIKKILYDEANDIFINPSLISYFNMHFYIYL